jgi:hypothetical protein
MSAWLSMMPVEGEYRAATQESSGSSASAWARVIQTTSLTPLARAFFCIPSSSPNWLSSAATISFPERRCGTPCATQYS